MAAAFCCGSPAAYVQSLTGLLPVWVTAPQTAADALRLAGVAALAVVAVRTARFLYDPTHEAGGPHDLYVAPRCAGSCGGGGRNR